MRAELPGFDCPGGFHPERAPDLRQRTAALVQGYRTRDAAFRIFRNEKLERYKTLFDLAARYSFLAANAYDYETGLLNTPAGRGFVSRIVSSRARVWCATGNRNMPEAPPVIRGFQARWQK